MKKITLTLNNRLNLGNYQHIDASVTFEYDIVNESTTFIDASEVLAEDAAKAIAYSIDKNYDELLKLKTKVKDLPK